MRPAPWKILLATLIPLLCALPAAAQEAPETAPAAEEPVAEAAPPLELVVHVPAGRLDLLRAGEVVRTWPVSVGAPKHPTLTGSYEVSKAVWNPWWHPPKSFWARNEKPTPPGPRNPMGRVKLLYAPLYFVHGTTETGKLGRPASHGCVRMANEDVVELATLLHEHATPAIGRAEIERVAEARGKTQEIPFERPVPLRIEYELVEIREDEVVVHPDVYRRGGGPEQLGERILDALAAHGVAADSVDREQVALLAGEARSSGASRSLDQLVVPTGTAVAAAGR